MANITATDDFLTKQVLLSIQQAHERLGHVNERTTKEIAKSLGWKLTGNQTLNGAACVAGKDKQKSHKKIGILDPNDEVNGYRAYRDISIVKKNENYPLHIES